MNAFTPVIRQSGGFAVPYVLMSNHPAFADDRWIHSQIATSLQMERWLDADSVEVAVSEGVVRLSGQIDSLHASLAVRRIAAMTPGVTMVVDDLWVPCE